MARGYDSGYGSRASELLLCGFGHCKAPVRWQLDSVPAVLSSEDLGRIASLELPRAQEALGCKWQQKGMNRGMNRAQIFRPARHQEYPRSTKTACVSLRQLYNSIHWHFPIKKPKPRQRWVTECQGTPLEPKWPPTSNQ